MIRSYGKMLVTNLHDSDYVKKNDNDGKLDHYENDSKGKHDSRKSIVVNDIKSREQLRRKQRGENDITRNI